MKNREKSDRTLRGNGDFVEVSWDDAIKLVAEEITRVKDAYGNVALHRGKSSWASNHAHVHRTEAMNQRFFNLIGGCTAFFGNYSNQAVNEIITGIAWGGTMTASDWPGIHKNAEMVVAWGANPLVTTAHPVGPQEHQGLARPEGHRYRDGRHRSAAQRHREVSRFAVGPDRAEH